MRPSACLLTVALAIVALSTAHPQPPGSPASPESASQPTGDVPTELLPPENEIVMSPGMRITATTPNGTIAITAGEGLERSYTWEGATRSVVVWPRQQRWYGSLGLYFPGPGLHWEDHNGVARGVLEEGQQHFGTVEEALEWIRSRTWMPHVYTDDGLVVGWMKVLPRRQLNVNVWQILINGERPTQLPGSQNESILVDYPDEASP